jgi:hypothetical protein
LELVSLSGKTLAVTPRTRIQVEGRRIEATEIREGDMLKVSYEVRDGQNVASSIDLIPGSRVAPGRHPASGESASRDDPYV